MKSNLFVGFFLLGSLAACGDDGGDPSQPAELSVAEYSSGLVEHTCAKAAGCCAPIELEHQFFFGEPVTDQASCEAALSGLIGDFLPQLYQASIDAGRATWNGDVAADCIAELEALTCDEYAAKLTQMGDAPLGCNPITPKVADGGECVIWWECTSGYCDEGSCAALPGAGDACPQAQCAEGLHCDMISETCQARLADGATCEYNGQCASNGCTETYDGPGVCVEASTCDDDLTDDEFEIYGDCSMSEVAEESRAIDCVLGTTGQWECDCDLNGTVTQCSPGGAELTNVCEAWGCCGF